MRDTETPSGAVDAFAALSDTRCVGLCVRSSTATVRNGIQSDHHGGLRFSAMLGQPEIEFSSLDNSRRA